MGLVPLLVRLIVTRLPRIPRPGVGLRCISPRLLRRGSFWLRAPVPVRPIRVCYGHLVSAPDFLEPAPLQVFIILRVKKFERFPICFKAIRRGLCVDFFGEPPELMWAQRLFAGSLWSGGESWRGGCCLGRWLRIRERRTVAVRAWWATRTRCFSGRIGWLRARLRVVWRWRMQKWILFGPDGEDWMTIHCA